MATANYNNWIANAAVLSFLALVLVEADIDSRIENGALHKVHL